MNIETAAKEFKAVIPTQGSQAYQILGCLLSGKKLTMLDAARLECTAVTQRCNELKRELGWPVKSEWKKLKSGKRVKEYSL